MGKNFNNGLLSALLFGYVIFELVQVVRAEYYVYVGEFFVKHVGLSYLLGHTAAYRNYHIAARRLQLFEHSYIAVGVVFGVFPYTAGVEHNNVGILHTVTRRIAQLFEHSRDSL